MEDHPASASIRETIFDGAAAMKNTHWPIACGDRPELRKTVSPCRVSFRQLNDNPSKTKQAAPSEAHQLKLGLHNSALADHSNDPANAANGLESKMLGQHSLTLSKGALVAVACFAITAFATRAHSDTLADSPRLRMDSAHAHYGLPPATATQSHSATPMNPPRLRMDSAHAHYGFPSATYGDGSAEYPDSIPGEINPSAECVGGYRWQERAYEEGDDPSESAVPLRCY
jgi:hypothetical protein